MRVIREGITPEITVNCSGNGNSEGGCGAVLGVSYEDVFHTESHARDESESYATICCIRCFKLTDIPKLSMPTNWSGWKSKKSMSPLEIKTLTMEKSNG